MDPFLEHQSVLLHSRIMYDLAQNLLVVLLDEDRVLVAREEIVGLLEHAFYLPVDVDRQKQLDGRRGALAARVVALLGGEEQLLSTNEEFADQSVSLSSWR